MRTLIEVLGGTTGLGREGGRRDKKGTEGDATSCDGVGTGARESSWAGYRC